ncbi:hypothetical protein VPH35_066491 [Triticum aestivum]
MAIGLLLEAVLGALNLILQACRVGAPVPVLGVEHRRHVVVPERHDTEIGIDAVETLERSTFDCRMERGVVQELHHWQPSLLAVRRVVDGTPQAHLQALIDALALAIGLQVVRCRIE